MNGVECEPYLTADHQLMLEKTEAIVKGLQIILRIMGVQKGYIGIEMNKPDALEAMKKATKGLSNIKVVGLKVKYPQGAEKQLIKAILGREVPPPQDFLWMWERSFRMWVQLTPFMRPSPLENP